MTKSILIIDKLHTCIIALLEKEGYVVDYEPDINRTDILKKISSYTGIIVRSKTNLDKEFFEAAKSLKFIGRAGAGLDLIDLGLVKEKGIKIVNAPEGNRDALAEHCMGMLLCLMNKMHTADRDIRDGKWEREANRGYEIMGKTIGLIGYGYMGQAFAKRLSSFGCKVLAYDKYKIDYSDQYAEEASLQQIFEETDILSLHIPLTSETYGMLNLDFFNKFKKNIHLINAARGEILPLTDLKYLLKSGKVLSAALDVLEYEKVMEPSKVEKEAISHLKASNSVLFTPHVGGWTYESYEKISMVLYRKILELSSI